MRLLQRIITRNPNVAKRVHAFNPFVKNVRLMFASSERYCQAQNGARTEHDSVHSFDIMDMKYEKLLV